MLNMDPLPSSESFNEVLQDFIKFSQSHVNLKEPVPVTEYTQDNAANPRYIQALYRRNRRRAVHKVMGERTRMCTEDPNALVEHFFNSQQAEFDLSIYDDWKAATKPLEIDKFTPAEFLSRLSNAENTSPDLDRLTYEHWR